MSEEKRKERQKRRRPAGEGHITKITLASGKVAYRAYLTVGYRTAPDGKRRPIRRTVQHRRQQVVIDRLAALREKYKADFDFDAEAAMKLSALLTRWLDHFCETTPHKKRTRPTYQWAIDKIRADHDLGDPLVARVTPLQLQSALDRLSATLAPSSVNLVRVVLKGAFGQAVMWRIRLDNPAQHLEIRAKSDEDDTADERRIITADEAAALLTALRGERLGLAVAFTYALGIRPGEAAALKVADFDFDKGTVAITATHNSVGGKIERERPKSARGNRTLPIPPALLPWVHQRIARAQTERQAEITYWTAPDEGLLFVGERTGGRIDGDAVSAVARRVARQIGLDGVGPRILRRSFLSHLGAAGIDPKVRAAIGGHTTAVTEKHYREVADSEIDAAMARVAPNLPDLRMDEEAAR